MAHLHLLLQVLDAVWNAACGTFRSSRPTRGSTLLGVDDGVRTERDVVDVHRHHDGCADGLLRRLHAEHLHAVAGELDPDDVVVGAADLGVERGLRVQT
jgi:hypothetical protein